MKRLAAIVLLAALTPPVAAIASDLQPGSPVPTSPSVPAPVLDKGGMVIPAGGIARVQPPVRERVAATRTAAMPLPTGYQPPAPAVAPAPPVAPAVSCAPGGCAPADCGSAKPRRPCLDRFKAWLCFQPTTGDALPKLQPNPYVGPITGVYSCTSANGYGCANGSCAPAGACPTTDNCGGRLGGLFGRGGRGGCVPPPDDAFPGYHFATHRPPVAASVTPPPTVPLGFVGHKPASRPTPTMPVSVQPREPQSRTAAPAAGPTIMPAAAVKVHPPGR
jgi:hypothetical protein